jgi:hypothetical protein
MVIPAAGLIFVIANTRGLGGIPATIFVGGAVVG